MADLLTPYGYDPSAPPIVNTVPMTSSSVSVRGPERKRTLVGDEEAGMIDRLNQSTEAQAEAERQIAIAQQLENAKQAEVLSRQGQIAATENAKQAELAQQAEERRRQREMEYDAHVKAFEDKHSRPKGYWDNHGVGDKIVAGIATALGGLGMAMAGKPGENPGLEAVNKTIDRWYVDQARTLDIDKDKIARSKVAVDDVDSWYAKQKLRLDAEKAAHLDAAAREAQAQGALAKNPEIKAKADKLAAELRAKAEEQKKFAMEGQRQQISDPEMSATRQNTGPTAEGIGNPKAPVLPGVGPLPTPTPQSAPGAQPRPLIEASAQAPARAPVTTTGASRVKTPKAPAAPGAPTSKPGVIAEGDIDPKALANGGVLYGYKGKPIAVIQDKKLAQDINKQTAALVDYSGAVISLGTAAEELHKAIYKDGSPTKINQAEAKFTQAYKDVRNKAKGAIATDALSDSEADAAIPLNRQSVLRGTYKAAMDQTLGAVKSKVTTVYSSAGIDPDAAFAGLMGKKKATSQQQQAGPDPGMVQRAREAAKGNDARAAKAREWLKSQGVN